jgi:hypothetical protein
MGFYRVAEYHLFNEADEEKKRHVVVRFLGGDDAEIFITEDDGTEPEKGVFSLSKKEILTFCDMLNGYERSF